jgi:hypothetical protein
MPRSGKHGGRAVDRALGRKRPPAHAEEAQLTQRVLVEGARDLLGAKDLVELLRHLLAGQRHQLVANGGDELDRVAVSVEYGVVEAATDLGESFRVEVAHASSNRSLQSLDWFRARNPLRHRRSAYSWR